MTSASELYSNQSTCTYTFQPREAALGCRLLAARRETFFLEPSRPTVTRANQAAKTEGVDVPARPVGSAVFLSEVC